MKISVLGCSGGIGGACRTTCLLVDDDILIDAGTGIVDISFQALANIDHIFVTHAHLDHILGIPLIADVVDGRREKPITIYALEETITHLRQYIFNWHIWPDFSILPTAEAPIIQFEAVKIGQKINLKGRQITVLPVNHAVPAVGYAIDSGVANLVFSGDTTSHQPFWASVNTLNNLSHVIVETSFANADLALARLSKHFCPSLLAEDLKHLSGQPTIHVTHLKPGEDEMIMQELAQDVQGLTVRRLMEGDSFTI
jgi:cAMP phosphodiesterase